MGSVDKGLQPLRGRPMVAWVIERFAPQVDEVLINANQNLEHYAALGHRVIPDEIAGYAGPLAGLHRGLTEAAHELVATVPCDSPFLPRDLVARLRAALPALAEPLLLSDIEHAFVVAGRPDGTGRATLAVLDRALFMRALELFVDPAVFAALTSAQRTVFRVIDVVLTGAVLGGGADGMHKLVSVFTNFMDRTNANLKGGTP